MLVTWSNALQILGAEQMRAGGDVARVFHHVVLEQLSEHRRVFDVDLLVDGAQCLQHLRLASDADFDHAMRLVEHVGATVLSIRPPALVDVEAVLGQRTRPPGDVLAKVADPLQVGGHRIAPTTERRSCAIGWRLAISVMARSSSSRCLAS